MRAQRKKRVKFKSGKIYTIRRISALAILFLIIILLFLIFKPKRNTKTTDNLNISNTNSNTQTESENNVQNSTSNNTDANNSKENSSIQEDATFTMAVTGDIMCHNTMYQDAYNSSTKSYDFSYFLKM